MDTQTHSWSKITTSFKKLLDIPKFKLFVAKIKKANQNTNISGVITFDWAATNFCLHIHYSLLFLSYNPKLSKQCRTLMFSDSSLTPIISLIYIVILEWHRLPWVSCSSHGGASEPLIERIHIGLTRHFGRQSLLHLCMLNMHCFLGQQVNVQNFQ